MAQSRTRTSVKTRSKFYRIQVFIWICTKLHTLINIILNVFIKARELFPGKLLKSHKMICLTRIFPGCVPFHGKIQWACSWAIIPPSLVEMCPVVFWVIFQTFLPFIENITSLAEGTDLTNSLQFFKVPENNIVISCVHKITQHSNIHINQNNPVLFGR